MNLPSRNELCPCHSGKKFKNCCLEIYRSKPPDWHPSLIPISRVNNWQTYQYVGKLKLRDEVICLRCARTFIFGEALFKSEDNGHHLIVCKHYPECEGEIVDNIKQGSDVLANYVLCEPDDFDGVPF